MSRKIAALLLVFVFVIISKSCYQDKFGVPEGVRVKPQLILPLVWADIKIEGTWEVFDWEGFDPAIDIESLIDSLQIYDPLTIVEVFPFTISDSESEFSSIYYLEFNVMVENGFPASAETMIYFVDANSNVLYVLRGEAFYIEAGTVDSETGETTEFSVYKSDPFVILTEEERTLILQATHVILDCKISNRGLTRRDHSFYLNYMLNIKLSTRLGFEYTFKF